MQPINQYTQLSDFIHDIENTSQTHFPFKVMGQKRTAAKKQTPIFYSASLLAEVYRSIPDPDAPGVSMPIQTVFGEIFNRGCNLNPESATYSRIIPHKKGDNLFQGDIVNLDLSARGKKFPAHRLSMILSHSCGIANSSVVCIVPVFLESELDQTCVDYLRGSATPNFVLIRGNWLRNENINYIGLPPIDSFSSDGDRILACLNLAMTVPKTIIPAQPHLRLTYRALSYLHARLALFFIRDVQDSDETRDF